MLISAASNNGSINYRRFGRPTISGNIYIPDTQNAGFIYTIMPFDPGSGHSWTIQTRVKINTAVQEKDIISTVVPETSGMGYSIACQTTTGNSNQQYALYLSSNGTSWDVANAQAEGVMPTGVWETFQIVCTYSGGTYYFKQGYPETEEWTNTFSATTCPKYGQAIAFGRNGIDAEYDLYETKIWIDGDLWWEPLHDLTLYSYIFYDGTAYIETDYVLPLNCSIRVGIADEQQHVAQQVFGASGSTGGWISHFLGGATDSTYRQPVACYDSSSFIKPTDKKIRWQYTSYGYFMTPLRHGWGNTTYTYTKGNLHPDGPLCLGAAFNKSSIKSTARMSSFWVYDTSASACTTFTQFDNYTPIATFRPCIYNGKAGVWHVEEGKFFGNSASGGTLLVSNEPTRPT